MEGTLSIARGLNQRFSVDDVPASEGIVSYPLPGGGEASLLVKVRSGSASPVVFPDAR